MRVVPAGRLEAAESPSQIDSTPMKAWLAEPVTILPVKAVEPEPVAVYSTQEGRVAPSTVTRLPVKVLASLDW